MRLTHARYLCKDLLRYCWQYYSSIDRFLIIIHLDKGGYHPFNWHYCYRLENYRC
ncbi:hypothetical protein BAZSYMA_ACONTIG102815_1 [Bathymodiolus azoricus thioautotrophic gill symbiont]|uniref:Uncharacterized protein n=1 Tax=Bathymodiolus azoricus thioautotrophic gill symbiont TaxID=235205 RepID=A0A1H6MFR4_9GAMM|nr:hypothetical protein BAZSYMA_ACONTIG102815_1 [Bathymodiolus azoricus thioautotrophic gill symbiont]